MRKTIMICATAILFALTSCGPIINYLGNTSSPPTDHVDVFFDENDIEREYIVLGHMTADAEDNTDGIFYQTMETVKNAMIEEAKKKGGDAIVFEDIRETVSGSYEYTEAVPEHGEGNESSESINQTKKIIKAKLLKYK